MTEFDEFVVSSQTTSHLNQTPFDGLLTSQQASHNLLSSKQTNTLKSIPMMNEIQVSEYKQSEDTRQQRTASQHHQRSDSKGSFLPCNKLLNIPNGQSSQTHQEMIKNSLRKNKINALSSINNSLKSTQITMQSQAGDSSLKKMRRIGDASQLDSNANSQLMDTRSFPININSEQERTHEQHSCQ